MTISLRAALLFVPVFGCASPHVARTGELVERLHACREELEAVVTGKHDELSDADLDLLEQAQVYVDRFHPDDVAGIVVVLRFGATLRDEDLPGVIEFGASKEGRMLAFPLQTLLVDRGRMDGAARLTTAALLDEPRDRRAYSTWKRWEFFFGPREDYSRLSHDFTFALLQRFEQGDQKEQQVVQDLLDKPELTREQIPDLRKAIDTQWKEMAALMAESAPPVHHEKIWVEDRRGLREVAAKSVLSVDRCEVRLRAGAEEPWGTLLLPDHPDPEEVMAKLAVLRQLAASAQDDGKDLGEGPGPIAVVLHNREPWELRARIDAFDESVTLALAIAELLRVRITHELPPDAARDERAVATAKALLTAVRGGARRLRELTIAEARKAPPDPVGDEDVLRVLRDTTADAMACFLELAASVPPPAADAGWRDMRITQGEDSGRTRVLMDADTVRIVCVDATQRASDVPGTTHGVRSFTLRREDLRDARFDASAPDRDLMVTTGRPVWGIFAESYPDSGGVRGGYLPRVWIPCDSEAHRDELIAALRKFAAEGR